MYIVVVVLAMLLFFAALASFILLIDMTVVYSIALINTLFYGGLLLTLIYVLYYYTKYQGKKYEMRLFICFFVWIVLNGAPLLLNYFCRSEEVYSEFAVITKQDTYKSRRDNMLLFPNGWECNYEDETMYENFKKGYTVKVYLQKGFLGMPIIIDYENELTIYDKALGLLKTGPLLDAIERFNESWLLEKHPDARWQMGRLYERFGQILESSIDYWDQEAYKMYREAYSAGSKNAKKDMKRLEKKLRK